MGDDPMALLGLEGALKHYYYYYNRPNPTRWTAVLLPQSHGCLVAASAAVTCAGCDESCPRDQVQISHDTGDHHILYTSDVHDHHVVH
jgi:hypothetical protein